MKALQEAKSNLQEGRFIVAVCGEMNSGKSTLLNALLFSEEVLPSHVTTMTAKIALMEGDETERVAATLYTSEEFSEVVKASKLDERSAQEMDKARETARAQGLRESDLLTNSARVISEDGLDKLVQFAAVCSSGGIYSAYVNHVQLWAEIEDLLNQAESNLSEKFLVSGFTGGYMPKYHLLPISAHTICGDAEVELTKNFDLEVLKKVVHSVTTGWQRFWDTKRGRQDAFSALKVEIEAMLRKTLEQIFGHADSDNPGRFNRTLRKVVQEALKTMEANCNGILEEKQIFLEELKEEISSDEDKRQEIDDQLVELERRERQVKKLKAEYDLVSKVRSA